MSGEEHERETGTSLPQLTFLCLTSPCTIRFTLFHSCPLISGVLLLPLSYFAVAGGLSSQWEDFLLINTHTLSTCSLDLYLKTHSLCPSPWDFPTSVSNKSSSGYKKKKKNPTLILMLLTLETNLGRRLPHVTMELSHMCCKNYFANEEMEKLWRHSRWLDPTWQLTLI